jgi:hypothetical protein
MRAWALMLLAATTAAAGCASTPHLGLGLAHDDAGPAEAQLGRDMTLALPSPPAYPETTTLRQTVLAHYGPMSGAFEAIIDLSPQQVQVVVTAAGGPRLATITWNEAGLRKDVTPLAMGAIPAENLMADIFVSLWPRAAVAAALPAGSGLSVEADGSRVIWYGDQMVLEVRRDAEHPDRVHVRNHALDYDVTVIMAPEHGAA